MAKREKILKTIQQILEEVLDVENLNITEYTTAKDVEDWDSIVHVEIIVAIEEYFDIKFRNDEIVRFKNIGDIVTGIHKYQDIL